MRFATLTSYPDFALAEEDAVDFWTGLEESVLRRNVPLELLDSTPRRTEPEFIWRWVKQHSSLVRPKAFQF